MDGVASSAAPTLERLSICGIRSFGPGDAQTISFDAPLTVISGRNGCGKTTIVECLKFATTGSLPPNSDHGQSFVFDPSMAGQNMVNANIKLMFRTRANRRVYFVSRNLRLTKKKTKLEFKQLDVMLKIKNKLTGEESTMSNRCSEVDATLPKVMGVTKAILENVIFCHQEESSWPLQESSVLKKKFDDIFESTRYSKALDEVKKQRKRLMDQHKQAESKKNVLDVHCKQAAKLEEDRDRLDDSIEDAGDQHDAVRAQLAERRTELAAMQTQMEETEGMRQDLMRMDAEKNEARRRLTKLEQVLREPRFAEVSSEDEAVRTKDPVELESVLAGTRAALGACEADQADATRLRRDAARAIDRSKEEQSRAETEQGRVEEKIKFAREAHLTFLRELRDALVRYDDGSDGLAGKVKEELKACEAGSGAGATSPAAEAMAREALGRLQGGARSAKNSLGVETQKADKVQDAQRNELATSRASRDALELELKEAEAEARKKDTASKELARRLKALPTGGSAQYKLDKLDQQLAKLVPEVSALEAQVKQQDAGAAEAKVKDSIRQCEARIDKHKAAVEKLERDYDKTQAYQRHLEEARTEREKQERALTQLDNATSSMVGFSVKKQTLAALTANLGGSSGTPPLGSSASALREANDSARASVDQLAEQAEAYKRATVKVLDGKEAQLKAKEMEHVRLQARREGEDESLRETKEQFDAVRHVELPADFRQELKVRSHDAESLEDVHNLVKTLHEERDSLQATFQKNRASVGTMTKLLDMASKFHVKFGSERCPCCFQTIPEAWPASCAMTEREAKAGLPPRMDKIAADGVLLEAAVHETKSKSSSFAFNKGHKVVGFDRFRAFTLFYTTETGTGDKTVAEAAFHAKKDAVAAVEEVLPDFRRKLELAAEKDKRATALRLLEKDIAKADKAARDLKLETGELRQERLAHATNALEALKLMHDSCESVTRLLDKARDLDLDVDDNDGDGDGDGDGDSAMGLGGAPGDALQAARGKKAAEEERLSRLRRDKDAAMEQKQGLQSKLQDAQREVNDVRDQKVKLREDVQEHEELVKQQKQVYEEKKQASDRGAAVRARRSAVTTEHQELEAKVRDAQEQASARLGKLRAAADELGEVVQKLQLQRKSKDASSSAGGAGSGLEAALAAVEAQVAALRADVGARQKEAKAASDAMRAAEGRNATLLALVEFLEKRRSYLSQREEALVEKEKRRKLQDDIRERTGNAKDHEGAIARKEEERRKLEREDASLAAKIEEIKRQRGQVAAELGQADYRNVERRQKEASIQAVTFKMASSDLDKYYKALDAALMQFHTMKIEEINKRILELWRVMYQGGDIDSIEVRSEGRTTATRRIYNYRVVMHKRDNILDMRGRCSAGQRVLAALVIRMALSESFSADCGVLTVDEPTVNLDEANKLGLANALAEVLKHHKDSRGFQLILITHDDDFVERIADKVKSLDMNANYFEVKRVLDPQAGGFTSVIRQITFHDD